MMCRRRYRMCGGTCAGADIHLLAWRVFLFVYCYTTHHHIVTLGGTARLPLTGMTTFEYPSFVVGSSIPGRFFSTPGYGWMDGWNHPQPASSSLRVYAIIIIIVIIEFQFSSSLFGLAPPPTTTPIESATTSRGGDKEGCSACTCTSCA